MSAVNALAGSSVLILGLGESGLAMARWCVRSGARVRVWDSREQPPHAATLAVEAPTVERLSGELDAAWLDGVQQVLKSPGLSPLDARLQPLLSRAREVGVPVHGELDLFVQALADLKAQRGYAPKLVAITGTNGKTTTTAMVALLIERAGRRVVAAGNIGPTMLQSLSDALDAGVEQGIAPSPLWGEGGGEGRAVAPTTTPPQASLIEEGSPDVKPGASLPHGSLPEVWVLELSSFQLDGVEGFAPDAAAVLNVTEDHLDWHGSMAAYLNAKARIQGPADAATVMIVNRDDAQVEAMVPAPVATKARVTKLVPRRIVRFGLDGPRRPGDYGIVTENGMAWLVRAQEADDTLRRGRRGSGPAEVDELYLQRLMPVDALRVRGRHNAANAMAALALAGAVGCPLGPMLHGLREYSGEPHRVQFITRIGDVDAFDDSKGTNVGATVAAINGLGADRAPAKLVLILGGDGKGQDFAPLVEPLQRHARAVATIGRDAGAIESAIEPARLAAGLSLQRHASLEAATRWSFDQAQAGDAVLLSPACASLDMFRNYGHRAEVFVREVERLAADAGEIAA